jgi:hypothetical protein
VVYGGFSDWRLPAPNPADTTCNDNLDPGGGFPTQYSGTGCTGGFQGPELKDVALYAVAVRPGAACKAQPPTAIVLSVMARHEHLPIYQAALDMKVHFERLVAGYSRHHKYTLEAELREGSPCTQSLELLGQPGLLQHAVGGVARKDLVVDREARPATR